MENLIIYGIVAIIVIISIIRNYQKEAKKNKERVLRTPQVRPVAAYGQENNQTRPAQAPFSKPRRTDSEERSYDYNSTETVTTSTVSDTLDKYQTITSMGYNYNQEGTSSLSHEYDETKNEKKAFTQEVKNNNTAQDLQLETSEDLRRAFIHSIILERKY